MAEGIEMPFWVVSEIGPENSVLDGDAHRRHLANTVERLCDCVDLLLVVAILPLPSLLFFYIFFYFYYYYIIISCLPHRAPSRRRVLRMALLNLVVKYLCSAADMTRRD